MPNRAPRQLVVRDVWINSENMAMKSQGGNPSDLASYDDRRGDFEYRGLSHELRLHAREGSQGEMCSIIAPELPRSCLRTGAGT